MQFDRVAEGTTYAAAATAFTLWGLSVSELAVLVSMTVAMASFVLHLWATIRRDRRESARYRREIEGAIRAEKEDTS